MGKRPKPWAISVSYPNPKQMDLMTIPRLRYTINAFEKRERRVLGYEFADGIGDNVCHVV